MVDKLRIKRKNGNENRIPTVESCITQFKKKIREGPFLYAMFAIGCCAKNRSNNVVWISILVKNISTGENRMTIKSIYAKLVILK